MHAFPSPVCGHMRCEIVLVVHVNFDTYLCLVHCWHLILPANPSSCNLQMLVMISQMFLVMKGLEITSRDQTVQNLIVTPGYLVMFALETELCNAKINQIVRIS